MKCNNCGAEFSSEITNCPKCGMTAGAPAFEYQQALPKEIDEELVRKENETEHKEFVLPRQIPVSNSTVAIKEEKKELTSKGKRKKKLLRFLKVVIVLLVLGVILYLLYPTLLKEYERIKNADVKTKYVIYDKDRIKTPYFYDEHLYSNITARCGQTCITMQFDKAIFYSAYDYNKVLEEDGYEIIEVLEHKADSKKDKDYTLIKYGKNSVMYGRYLEISIKDFDTTTTLEFNKLIGDVSLMTKYEKDGTPIRSIPIMGEFESVLLECTDNVKNKTLIIGKDTYTYLEMPCDSDISVVRGYGVYIFSGEGYKFTNESINVIDNNNINMDGILFTRKGL